MLLEVIKSLEEKLMKANERAEQAWKVAWEAERIGDPARLALARLVLAHRVLPRDPLAAAAEEAPESLLARALAA